MMSETLVKLSNDLAAAVERVAAGTVTVDARRRYPATGIIWSENGLVVTAHHVVQQEKKITIGLPGGERIPAELVGRDPTTDLALLKAQSGGLTPAARAMVSPESLKVGNMVVALGRPGTDIQATLGIVSALSAKWRSPTGSRLEYYLQPDIVMYPGFSGGPLATAGGDVVGLNTSALMRGVSLAIPVNTIERVTAALLKDGHIKRGYLGVSTQAVKLPAGLKEQLSQETGLLLIGVEADSPAEQGGLLLGDTIVTVNDSAVRQHDDLLAQLSGDLVGRPITVQIIRGGQLTTVDVTVGERE
jgi:S1-C subfamily serine protease